MTEVAAIATFISASRRNGTMSCIASTTLQMVLAMMIGAWIDEVHHSGVSAWRSMCQAGSLPWRSALSVQLTLLPTAITAMFAMAAAQIALAAVQGPASRLALVATCHLSCAAVMLLSLDICARVVAGSASSTTGLLTMLLLEFLIATALAITIWHAGLRTQRACRPDGAFRPARAATSLFASHPHAARGARRYPESRP